VIGNAGSFFKNPIVSEELRNAVLAQHPSLVSYPQESGGYKLAAGWLIEQSGWKGKRVGNVGVFEKQALVLVNHGGATGMEVRALAAQIQADVKQKFGVDLEVEPVFVE
jgi:UDP-N-acetylmuramate dehydrogenase